MKKLSLVKIKAGKKSPNKKAKTPKFKVPVHLAKETQKWWKSVVGDWTLEDHHVRLLTAACEAWDRCQQARKRLAKEGLIFKDRFGQPRARPEITIERDSRLAFARLLRELDLDVDPPREPGRPPGR